MNNKDNQGLNNKKHMSGEFVLRACNLHKKYSTPAEELHVLKGLDLEVKRGEIVAIMGESGSGKSTLLHLLGGMDKPNDGEVLLDGMSLYKYSEKKLSKIRNKSIGFVFQFHFLLPEFTALENVLMPSWIGGNSNIKLNEKYALELLEQVGIKSKKNRKPQELSGGEQQRVAVARALLNEPIIVLADEPSGNLDRKNSEELHELIVKLCQTKGTTFVIATHNNSLANKANRILQLIDGKLFLLI